VENISLQLGKVHIAERIIKKWNVTDDAGNALMITPQNIRHLPAEVLDWILEEWDKRQVKNPLTPTLSEG
jgi:hypothetical protein